MKIAKINTLPQLYNTNSQRNKNQSQNQSNPIDITNSLKIYAYRDFNITFSGRTPEDFYAQDFNRNNMPDTMKDYLDYDYEHRQHIPPEQMMREVFKYLNSADNFADVKSIYPNESLFKNLHENKINSRKGILSEIKVARDLGDAPLLNDGSNNFGMYLLKKIYLEGKTLKEISKDFLEKDINDEYKGFVTEPVNYSTLSAYGISYPNNGFWHSFIHTRDEYKKFFVSLPKNDYIPGVNTGGHSGSSSNIRSEKDSEIDEKPRKRRFNIRQHHKKEIKKDIIDKKFPDAESVKKSVTRRFGKDDPEASFLVRYMSPIMAVAAERAHMSEELKSFAEHEQLKGKNGDGRTMFERFWKQNPKMLEVFSSAITDTMDMFEDFYSAGGMIAINSNLEKITPTSEKQKIIDYVNPEFLDLLRYAQSIESERNKKYDYHNEMQKQWEEHFIERYGDPNNQIVEEVIVDTNETIPLNLSLEEQLEIESKKNNAKVYKLKSVDGTSIYVTTNLDEVLEDEINNNAKFLPSRYASRYIKATKEQNFSEKFKLTLAAAKTDFKYCDEQLQSQDEFDKEFHKLIEFHLRNPKNERAARMAILDSIVLESGLTISPVLYDTPVYFLNTDIIDGDDNDVEEFKNYIKTAKKTINSKYDYYTSAIGNSENNKIKLKIFNMLNKYDGKDTILDKTTVELIKMVKESLPYQSNKEVINIYLNGFIHNYPYLKCLLTQNEPNDIRQAKFEIIMEDIVQVLMAEIKAMPNLVMIFNSATYNRHKANLVPEVKTVIENAINKLDYKNKFLFYYPQNK